MLPLLYVLLRSSASAFLQHHVQVFLPAVPLHGPARFVGGAAGPERAGLAVGPGSPVVDAAPAPVKALGFQFLPRRAEVDVPFTVVPEGSSP